MSDADPSIYVYRLEYRLCLVSGIIVDSILRDPDEGDHSKVEFGDPELEPDRAVTERVQVGVELEGVEVIVEDRVEFSSRADETLDGRGESDVVGARGIECVEDIAEVEGDRAGGQTQAVDEFEGHP